MNINEEPAMQIFNILLADDDKDDCLLFKEALHELDLDTRLTTVHDGEQLFNLFQKTAVANFDMLFLDLNMPRKNGFACLDEIQSNDQLCTLPVIIFSTSLSNHMAEMLISNGAALCIRKPAEFSALKSVIAQSVNSIMLQNTSQNNREIALIAG